MAYCLIQATDTPEAWAAQLKDPRNRLELTRPVVERVGARSETEEQDEHAS